MTEAALFLVSLDIYNVHCVGGPTIILCAVLVFAVSTCSTLSLLVSRAAGVAKV